MSSTSKKSAASRGRSGNPAKKPIAQATPATFGDWVGAARLRTLPLAIAPVVIGSGAAKLAAFEFHWVIALACLAVAVLLQIGVNYANDYSDGIRGTDDFRVGPARLTGAGKAKPRTVLIVSLTFFALAALAGLAIVIRTQQWWLLAVGAVCIVAAWFYTGGKRPYGYAGLGELFVFVFFGLVATLGTTWVQALLLPQEAWFGAVAAGFLACAVLLANNLRDIDQDRLAGKRTLTVRIGKRATQVLFTVLIVLALLIAAFLALFYPIAWLALMSLLASGPAIVIVWTYRKPGELVIALALVSLSALIYAGALFWAFWGIPAAAA
ncbi:1,4-dihydroxy-2-naphthoate polyprenyltransferase [Microbacterium gorillae]|uniref:1,4-dihydroxy-2-naphthoate polyprenyltransferase n=1 Tax=Microbacterium gorillae TaxID=1231063 RepID=UPI003D96517E